MNSLQIANNIIDELNKLNIKSYIWYKAKTGSIYIRFDECLLGSIRIADHEGRQKYNYKYNIRSDYKFAPKWYKNENYWRYYCNIKDWKTIIDIIHKNYTFILENNMKPKFKYGVPKQRKNRSKNRNN